MIKELLPGIEPFAPENIIVFGVGLLAGTGAPGASRLSIDSLNPLTGGIGSSNCGGGFASELRSTGIDHLLIKGKSSRPVYLYIDGEEIIFKEAGHLKGQSTVKTEEIIKRELETEDIQVLSIGPAGENLVRSACIIVNRARAAGRCGLGAVMGSKNLKAIVVKGEGTIDVRDKKSFNNKVKYLGKWLKEDEFNGSRKKYGVYCYHPWGGMDETPYRNFQGGQVPPPEKTARILPDVFLEYKKETKGCSNCPIKCWSIHQIDYEGETIICEGLQGNDPHNFGAKLNIFDARGILKGHALCNQLGLDTDNACGVIAWAFECYQRGILTRKDTDGLALEWGDQEVIFALLNKIARKEGIGKHLAEGSRLAAEVLGGAEYSINIKGQELMESLRASVAWALGTAVSARGGTHTRGAVIETRLQNLSPEKCKNIFGVDKLEDLHSYNDKEKLVFFFERVEAMLDCLGMCMFTNSLRVDMMMPQDYAELLSIATGWEIDKIEFMKMGERIHTLEKCFNVIHQGWTRIDDYPPERFFNEPILNGPRKGQKLNREKWSKLLDRYYEIHGWDRETGWPTEEILKELGLEDIACWLKK